MAVFFPFDKIFNSRRSQMLTNHFQKPSRIETVQSPTFHLMGDMTFRGETTIAIDIWNISLMASIEPVIIPNMVMTVEFDLWLHFTWTKNYLFPQTKMLFFHSNWTAVDLVVKSMFKNIQQYLFFRCERDFSLILFDDCCAFSLACFEYWRQ